MKVTFETKTLFAALNRFSGICGANATVSATEGIKIDCGQNALANTAILSGTNLRTTLEVQISCEIVTGGVVIVPWRLLLDTVKAASTEHLTLTSDGTSATIAGKGKYKMPVFDPAQFPNVEIPDISDLTLTLEDFKCIEKCLPFAGNDELRPPFTGVNMTATPTGTEYCATDGNRLCTATSSTIAGKFSAILPAELCKVLKSVTGVVSLGQTERELIVTGDAWRMKVAKIEGRYPAYQQVIPKDNPHRLTVSKTAFISSLRRVGIYSDTNTHAVDLLLTEGKEMRISAIGTNFDLQAEETLACTYQGEGMQIRFNAKFLSAAVQAADAEEVCFEIGHPTKAALIRNPGGVVLVMPLFVG
jgi:DNA polymerase-3 subunit beta